MSRKSIKYLLPIIMLIFIFFTCGDDYYYQIKNNTNKEIKVIFIDNEYYIGDTIGKYIIEPGVLYDIYTTNENIIWVEPNDTLHYGYTLIITQGQKIYKNDIKNAWSQSGHTFTLNVMDEDFE